MKERKENEEAKILKKKGGWPKGKLPTPEVVRKRIEANRFAARQRRLMREFA